MINEFGLNRIEVNIIPKNIHSLSVVRKLRFCNKRLVYKYLKIN